MALAYDKGGGDYEYNTSTSGCTFNLAAASADSVAIIFVIYNPAAAGADWANTPTVGGVSATQIGSTFNWTGTQYMRAYYFLNPPTSSTAYLVTTDTIGVDKDIEMHALIYSGADQVSQPDSNNTGSATPSVTLSTTVVASNCWLVSCGRNANVGIPSAGTGTTLRSTAFDTSFASGDSNGTVGTGAQTMQWTAAAGLTAGIIISIDPSGGVTVTAPPLYVIFN